MERISDITLGDAWGSELDLTERKKGLSLLLIQTQKGKEIVENAEMYLEDVDLEKSIAANHQLEYPSVKCPNSAAFWEKLKAGEKFDSLVKEQFPKQCFRQNIKQVLLKMKLIHR